MRPPPSFLRLLLSLAAALLGQGAALGQGLVAGSVPGVVATASSSQVPGYNGTFRTTTDEGLSETAPGSGVYQLDAGQVGWTSSSPDANALIHFDLGQVRTINRFHVWNYNEPGYLFRGFRDVTVQHSNDAVTWRTTPQRFTFPAAPGASTYTGQAYVLTWPITARYLRFWCDGTYGPREQCGLHKVRFFEGGAPATPPATSGIFPADARVINVKEAPYLAAGDGVTDDHAALQAALRDWEGTLRPIYLPAGTYRVSQPLRCRNNNEPSGTQRNGLTFIRGESRATTTIRLDDGVLPDPAQPRHLLYTGFFIFNNGSGNSADWFAVTITDLTLDTGRNNPGAKGLGFYSNNTGVVRDVDIRSGDGQGAIGLDCGYAGQNGPNTVKRVRVFGFDVGIYAADAINSQAYEDIELHGQRVVGLLNDVQVLSVRRLVTTGSVPAVRSNAYYAHLTLIEAQLTGAGNGANAVENEGVLLARDVVATGWNRTINNFGGAAGGTFVTGNVGEYRTLPSNQLFPSSPGTLRLPVEETPEVPRDPPAAWANARNFRLTTEIDNGPAIQRAIDSGATTVYLPTGNYSLQSPIVLRGNLRRLEMLFSGFYRDTDQAALRLEAGVAPAVVVSTLRETFTGDIPLIVAADRALVCLDLAGVRWEATSGVGRIFVENCVGPSLDLGPGARLWARGLNIENNFAPGSTALLNAGGRAWVLGYKTEGAATIITTRRGGETELLGGLNYSAFTGGQNPMFRVEDSRASLNIAEVNFVGQPFNPVVAESRAGVARALPNDQVVNYVGGTRLALYSANRDLVTAAVTRPPGGPVQLAWTAVPTRTYRVEFTDSLAQPWQELAGSPVTAAAGEYTLGLADAAAVPRRFYRVELTPRP